MEVLGIGTYTWHGAAWQCFPVPLPSNHLCVCWVIEQVGNMYIEKSEEFKASFNTKGLIAFTLYTLCISQYILLSPNCPFCQTIVERDQFGALPWLSQIGCLDAVFLTIPVCSCSWYIYRLHTAAKMLVAPVCSNVFYLKPVLPQGK